MRSGVWSHGFHHLNICRGKKNKSVPIEQIVAVFRLDWVQSPVTEYLLL